MILPEVLSIAMTSPAVTFSFDSASIILLPRSYIVSISVVLMVSLPVFVAYMRYLSGRRSTQVVELRTPVKLRSI